MELKLVVRPIVGCLTHSHFWEGPCRAGHLEDMTPEAEKKAADAAFAAAKETLKQATDEIEFLPFWEKGVRFFKVLDPNNAPVEFCQIL